MVRLDTCKFGDKLRTRDGRMAVFMNKLPNSERYNLAVSISKEREDYYSDCYRKIEHKIGFLYRSQYLSQEYSGDIIDKWEDEK